MHRPRTPVAQGFYAAIFMSLFIFASINAIAEPSVSAVDRSTTAVTFLRTVNDAHIWHIHRETFKAVPVGGRIVLPEARIATDLVSDIELQRFDVIARDAQVHLGRRDGADVRYSFNPNQMAFYRGRLRGVPDSDVFLAIGPRSTVGFINADARNLHISSTSTPTIPLADDEIAVFEPTSTPGVLPAAPVCGVTAPDEVVVAIDGAPGPAATPSVAGDDVFTPRTQVIEIAVDSDYEFFSLFPNADAAVEYVYQLYGSISHIYLRDVNTRLVVTFVRIWDTPDDLFNESDPFGPFRTHWALNMNDVHRDVAQLLTGRRNLPYGGVAFLNGLCNGNAYSVNGYLLGSFVSPESPSTGNWDMIVTAHELGHNCGTGHTHDGYVPTIDDCAFGEVTRGTIMSYCHTQAGGVANLDPRLHRRVQSVVRQFVSSAACVMDDCNFNDVHDPEETSTGETPDVNNNNIPDECEDCNQNGILDTTDIVMGMADVNFNNIPDECEPDCNANGIPDPFESSGGAQIDRNGNNTPDECEPDCDDDGEADPVVIADDMSLDVDRNAVLDVCQDCDGDGVNDFEARNGAHDLWIASFGFIDHLAAFDGRTGVFTRNSESAANMSNIEDLIVHPNGRIFLTQGASNRIVEFDRGGALIGNFVSGDQNLSWPRGLTVHPNGNLLTTSRFSDSVVEFDIGSGNFVRQFVVSGAGGLSGPYGLVFGPNGNLFVAGLDSHQVHEYDGDTGESVGPFLQGGPEPLWPTSLAFKRDSNLLVVSRVLNMIFEFDGRTGVYIGEFVNNAPVNTFWRLVSPWTVRIGPDGQVYVSGRDSSVFIHKYDSQSGIFLRSFYLLPQAGFFSPTGFDFVKGFDVDCNVNFIPDNCDIDSGVSEDANSDGIPDECQIDCNGNGVYDRLDLIPLGRSVDCNANGVPDECDIAHGASSDCDGDGWPDDCGADCNGNGLADSCETDCNANATPDDCDIMFGDSFDFNNDDRPDECGPPIDLDGDGDVDLHEFQVFYDCVGVKLEGPVAPCGPFDADGDGDIDLLDFARLQSEFTGDCPIIIVENPQSIEACFAATAQLSVQADGENVSFHWTRNGVLIPDQMASTLTIESITAAQAGAYRVYAVNDCNVIAAAPATITVREPPMIALDLFEATVCPGASLIMSADAVGVPPLTYQWQFNEENIAGAQTATLELADISESNQGLYNCVVTDGAGCEGGAPPAELRLHETPQFQSHPANAALCAGETLFLTASATGLPGYQWHKNGLPIDGATELFIAIPNATVDDSGAYTCEAIGQCGSVFSDAAVVTISECP